MSNLADTPIWRPKISQAPRASLTIRMDAERDGAIPLTELADIARTVQQTVNQIARALNDRSRQGRTPEFLRKLSALEAVGIGKGSAVLEIEAPHDMEQFPIEFGEADAGVQSVELFVATVDALAHGEEPPQEIGDAAKKSIHRFLRAVGNHEYVEVESSVRSVRTIARFDPPLISESEPDLDERPEPIETIEMVGHLYAVDIENHVYRIRDELGRARRVRIGDDLDDRMLARTLIGETVHIVAHAGGPGDAHADEPVARTLERVAPPEASEYYDWDLDLALETVKPLASIDDLAIPGLTDAEADAFWEAINE